MDEWGYITVEPDAVLKDGYVFNAGEFSKFLEQHNVETTPLRSVYIICTKDYKVVDSRYFTDKAGAYRVCQGLNAKREAKGKEPKYYYLELTDIRGGEDDGK